MRLSLSRKEQVELIQAIVAKLKNNEILNSIEKDWVVYFLQTYTNQLLRAINNYNNITKEKRNEYYSTWRDKQKTKIQESKTQSPPPIVASKQDLMDHLNINANSQQAYVGLANSTNGFDKLDHINAQTSQEQIQVLQQDSYANYVNASQAQATSNIVEHFNTSDFATNYSQPNYQDQAYVQPSYQENNIENYEQLKQNYIAINQQYTQNNPTIAQQNEQEQQDQINPLYNDHFNE